MNRIPIYLLILLLFIATAEGFSQSYIGSSTGDESIFYAQTKQVNQFFLRFNGEETVAGKRLYPGDAGYRDSKARKSYIGMLFDKSSPIITSDLKYVFTEEVLNKKNPYLLDFYKPGWFAEAACSFTYKKEKVNVLLYLKIEKQKSGYKWVISKVYFDRFEKWFTHLNDTVNLKYFIHPMSHELDFMNLHKAFQEPDNLDYYFEKGYTPDMTALFVMEMKNGNMVFNSVSNVKFHVFQVPGWYFEISFQNRNDMNSGWLISNLLRISEKDKKALIKNYTHIN